MDSLVAQGDREGYTESLRANIVKLSKTKRVPSPFTSFLVVESEDDRKALIAPPVKPAAPKPAARKESTPLDLTDMIATTAYFLAAERHFSPGHDVDDWLEAERRVHAQLDA